MMRLQLIAKLILAAIVIAQTAQAADCPCGYDDPTTGAFWTDAIITYFNETGTPNDIVSNPAVSPYIQGHLSAGKTGNGTQDWSIVGDQADPYEEAFGATYRSAVSYNNTAIRNNELQMLVQPADRKDRIVYGAEFVTRRRDILYGSFRASMNVQYMPDAGTGFQMSAMYNDSETIDLGLYTADIDNNSTLRWSYSARGTDADPVEVPLAALHGASIGNFLEHRFDWKSDSILYSNNNTNITASSLLITKDSSHDIPSMPVPISFRHWSDGNPQASEGPPLFQTKTGRVRYTRFFFNSSLPSRQQEFTSQCAAANVAACSTEDLTLRGSTAFSQNATLAVPPYSSYRPSPKYSLIGMAISAGVFIILVLHSLLRTFYLRKVAGPEVSKADELGRHNSSSSASTEIDDTIASPFSKHAIHEKRQIALSAEREKNSLAFGSGAHMNSRSESSSSATTRVSTFSFNNENNRTSGAWNVASLTQAQLDVAGDDGEVDEDSDDDDFMEDCLQEIDISNDDGLGRPDRLHYNGNHHLHSRVGAVDLPQSVSPFDTTIFQAQPHGGVLHHGRDKLPADPSTLAAVALLGKDDDVLARLNPPPTAWRDSVYNTQSSQGTPSWTGSSSSFSKRDVITPVDSQYAARANSLSSDDDNSSKNRPASFLDYYMPTTVKQPDHRNSAASSFTMLNEKASANNLRRTSVASLNALALSKSGTSPFDRSETPTISVWTRLNKDGENGDVLAARVEDKKKAIVVVNEKKVPWWKAVFNYIFVLEGGAARTASGAARINYLEGLRGFSCFLVSLNHFMLMFWFATTTEGAPTHTAGFEVWFYRLISPVFFNQGTKIGIFFVLPARVMGTRYMLRGNMQDLADSTIRRIPRLAFPTFAAVLINYFLIQVQAYQWVLRLPSRTWSTWAYFQDFDSIGSFINAWIGLWFTLPPQDPVLLSTYATGVLWTIPVIVQSSFAILITVVVSKELPNVYKRYGFFISAMALSWYANRFDYYFIAGLVIADMDNKLDYRKVAARGMPIVPSSLAAYMPPSLQRVRLHGQIIGWILFLGGSMIQYLEYLDAPGGHFNRWEHGILPDFATAQPRVWVEGAVTEKYNDPRFSLFCMVIGIFILCDLCQSFANFFMLRWWSALGRNGFSLYLLHGTIFWTWGAWLCIQLLTHNVPYWAAITIVFITSYFILAIACELFTRSFDAWGVSMSKALWRYTSGGLGRRD